MKYKLLPKYLIAGVIALSIFSFAYVNLHSGVTCSASCEKKTEKVQPVLIEEEEDKATDLPIPDVTIISRVLDVVQRVTSTH